MKTYTSTTNRKGVIEYTKRNEFEYIPNHSKAVLFVGMLLVLAIAVLIMGVMNVRAASDKRLHYAPNGCVPYTYSMITTSYASGMTHSPCNGSQQAERDNRDNEDTAESTIELPVIEDTAAVEPVVTEAPVVTPPAVDPTEEPTIERKQKCNNGEGNGSEGCSPANSDNANNDENDTTPREDKSTGSLGFAGFIFVTFRIGRGKKDYFANVSSWHYTDTGALWLYLWPTNEDGTNGNCGYVPNGKVISTSVAEVKNPFMPDETLAVLKIW
jgi:hypothetical protein